MYNLIGISGKKRSGKNTISSLIKQELRKKVVEYAFADELKREVALACKVSVEYIEQHKDNFRLMLQGWGTDYKRKLVSDDYWVLKTFRNINEAEPHVAIITDVRFKSEAQAIKAVGGVIVRVSRNTGLSDNHISETDMDDYKADFIIDNNGSIEETKKQVKELVLKIK